MEKVSLAQQWCADHGGEGALLADGFEEAFLGLARQFTRPPVAVYDRKKCIEILMRRDGMTCEEAEDYFAFNVAEAWVGEQTPMFLEVVSPK